MDLRATLLRQARMLEALQLTLLERKMARLSVQLPFGSCCVKERLTAQQVKEA